MYSVVISFEAYKVTRLISSLKDTEERPVEELYVVYVSQMLKNWVQYWIEKESITHSPWGGACIAQPKLLEFRHPV